MSKELFEKTTTTTTTIATENDLSESEADDSLTLVERMQNCISSSSNNDNTNTTTNKEPIQLHNELLKIYEQIYTLSLFSINESLNDISTNTLQLLCIEHYLAISYYNLPITISPITPTTITTEQNNNNNINNNNNTIQVPDMSIRLHNLLKACTLWNQFLHRLELLSAESSSNFTSTSSSSSSSSSNIDTDLLSIVEIKQYHTLIELTDQITQYVDDSGLLSNSASSSSASQSSSFQSQSYTQLQLLISTMMSHSIINISRDEKINNYNRKQLLQNEQSKLLQLQQRRNRLQYTNIISNTDTIDGYDNDELIRTISYHTIILCKYNTYTEWISTLREIPMILNHLYNQNQQQQQSNQLQSTRMTSTSTSNSNGSNSNNSNNNNKSNGLQLTHITQDNTTGLLSIRKEQLKSSVFQPSWNLPTMTLDELATIEVTDAIRRSEQQKISENYQLTQPQRYELLVKHELEDNINLVDASAIVDRQWDDFKDANPRGSGNKRGNVGDRNF